MTILELDRAIERLAARKSEVLRTFPSRVIERGVVERFREAIGWPCGDPDEVPAMMIAHLFRDGVDVHRDERPRETVDDALVNPVNGGTEFELLRRPGIGDAIGARSVLKDAYSRQGKAGRLGFVVTETRFDDDAGSLVAVLRVTMIYRGVA